MLLCGNHCQSLSNRPCTGFKTIIHSSVLSAATVLWSNDYLPMTDDYCPMTNDCFPMTIVKQVSCQTCSWLHDAQAPHCERREEEPHPQALHGPVCEHGSLQPGGQHVHPCPVQAPARHLPGHPHLPGSTPTITPTCWKQSYLVANMFIPAKCRCLRRLQNAL